MTYIILEVRDFPSFDIWFTSQKNINMIARIWHGYTTIENADMYEDLLKHEIFERIENKKMAGYKGIQLLKRQLGSEFEFTTIMWFDRLENVKEFMGEDYEIAYVLPQAKKLLKRFDKKSIHCELLHELKYGPLI